MQYHYRIHKNVDIKLITCFFIICVYDQIKFVKCEPKYICNCHQDVPVNELRFYEFDNDIALEKEKKVYVLHSNGEKMFTVYIIYYV
jgi:hypothetical protein